MDELDTGGDASPARPPAASSGTAAGDAGPVAAQGAPGIPLDQEDIDSLVGGPPDAGDDAGARSRRPNPDRPNDPDNPEGAESRRGLEALIGTAIVGYDRLPMLDIVVDRFARTLTTNIRKYTQYNCDVSTNKTRAIRVGDFLGRISVPAMIAVVRAEQWDGYILAALDAGLIASVVDVLLGGRRNQAQTLAERPCTPIERALVERLVADVVLHDLKRAFDGVCEIDFVPERYETTPTYAAITELSAAAVAFRAEVAMDSGRGGAIDFLIPYSVLEPVRDTLSQEFMGKKQQGDHTWHSHLRGEVPQASVELHAVLEQRLSTVWEVARWRPGSVLVLDRRAGEPVDLFCEEMLVARGLVGENDGRIALRIEERATDAPEPAPQPVPEPTGLA